MLKQNGVETNSLEKFLSAAPEKNPTFRETKKRYLGQIRSQLIRIQMPPLDALIRHPQSWNPFLTQTKLYDKESYCRFCGLSMGRRQCGRGGGSISNDGLSTTSWRLVAVVSWRIDRFSLMKIRQCGKGGQYRMTVCRLFALSTAWLGPSTVRQGGGVKIERRFVDFAHCR